MALYKERGVNPATGCLPMVPTMIVLFGLYGALTGLSSCDPNMNLPADQCHPFRQPFLWVLGAGRAGRLPHSGPGLSPIPGILPIAMAVSQFFSSKMMTMPSQDPQQQMMNRMMTVMMPGMMLFWGISFPAGLVLYWFVSNLYEMVRLYFTMGPQLAMAASDPGGGFSFGSLLRGSSSRRRDDPVEDKTTTADQAGDGTGRAPMAAPPDPAASEANDGRR